MSLVDRGRHLDGGRGLREAGKRRRISFGGGAGRLDNLILHGGGEKVAQTRKKSAQTIEQQSKMAAEATRVENYRTAANVLRPLNLKTEPKIKICPKICSNKKNPTNRPSNPKRRIATHLDQRSVGD